MFLGGGSNYDINGFNTSSGKLQDIQRTLAVVNPSKRQRAGSVTFGTLEVSASAS